MICRSDARSLSGLVLESDLTLELRVCRWLVVDQIQLASQIGSDLNLLVGLAVGLALGFAVELALGLALQLPLVLALGFVVGDRFGLVVVGLVHPFWPVVLLELVELLDMV